MTEDVFRHVFSKFFPCVITTSLSYSHHVFTSLDTFDTGFVNFEEFATTLAILTQGTKITSGSGEKREIQNESDF